MAGQRQPGHEKFEFSSIMLKTDPREFNPEELQHLNETEVAH